MSVAPPPSHRFRWTFASRFPPQAEMSNSRARFETDELALRAAVNWLEVCCANEFYPAVQIVKLEPGE